MLAQSETEFCWAKQSVRSWPYWAWVSCTLLVPDVMSHIVEYQGRLKLASRMSSSPL